MISADEMAKIAVEHKNSYKIKQLDGIEKEIIAAANLGRFEKNVGYPHDVKSVLNELQELGYDVQENKIFGDSYDISWKVKTKLEKTLK